MEENSIENVADCEIENSELTSSENEEHESSNVTSQDLSEIERARAALDLEDLPAAIEAILLASGEPIAPERLQEVFALTEDEIITAINALIKRYEAACSGIEIRCVAGQYQLRTKTQYAAFIKALNQAKPRKLSPAALETLAIIAYRQPIVKSDVETIRGVDATPTIKTLLDRKLIKIIGHQASVGQPALYGTTDEFMKIFGLSSLSELPSLRDLKELDADPGEEPDLFANNLKEENTVSEGQ